MDAARFDAAIRVLGVATPRRVALGSLLGAGFAGTLIRLSAGETSAKNKKRKNKKKKCKNCCLADGRPCKKKSAKCKAQLCLDVPFTIEANWTVTADHDSFLFVPPENGTTGPSPFIEFSCTALDSSCEEGYPFACFSGDVKDSGSEIATIFQLLPGTYEYWNEIATTTLAGELTIVLKNKGGRIIRQWQNPANPVSSPEKGWHVFNIDGSTGIITSVDELSDGFLPQEAHDPSTAVCPFL